MDEDEELYREMNEEDDLYMGDRDDYDEQDNSPNSSGMGCLVMLPLLVGALTFMVIFML